MSKIDGARPTSNIASRAGLARYRQLQEQPTGADQPRKTNLPNGWFYNETKQEEFWQDLEGNNPNLANDGSQQQDQDQHYNDITTCANRVQSLLSEFDALDQDMLMELMEIVEHDNDLGDIDQYSFICDTKNNVMINIDELKEFAEDQSVLMNTIKNWLTSVQNSINVETNDPVTQEAVPDVDHVYTNLADILKSYTERSEKAAFLHNDVNEFWSKQNAQLKKIIYARDEEIRKLQATLQAALASRQRKNSKKGKPTINESDSALQFEIDQQSKIIQDQKNLIDRLKSQLQMSESEKIIAQIGNQPNIENNVDDSVQKNFDLETKNSILSKQIEDLLNEMEKVRFNLTNEKEKNSSLNKSIADKDQRIGEMEILLQKYLNQLSLEKNKPTDVHPPEDGDQISKEELYIAEMKYKEKIKEIKASHAQELIEQAEMLEQRFQREKNLLLESIQSPDNQTALKSLIDEYDSKFENQKEEYNKMLENIKSNWASKIALLTRQYEMRINKMNTSHEFELINAQNSIKYEVKKSELDVTEKFNQDLLKMTSEKTAQINSMQDEIDKKSDAIFSLQKQLTLLQQKLSKYESTQPVVSESKDNSDQTKQEIQDNKSQVLDEIAKFANRYNNLKSNLDEQHIWDLSMQKNFYESELTKRIDQKQKEIRSILIEFEDAVVNKEENSENEKGLKTDKIDEVVEKVVSALSSLNEQYQTDNEKSNSNESEEEKVPISEARKRTSLLTERIISLNNRIEDLENEADSASKIPKLEEMIQRLHAKIKFLEDLQSGDQKELTKKFDEMEAKYLDELRFKDDLIKEMQNSIFSKKKPSLSNSKIEQFFVALGDSNESSEYDYEEDLSEKNQQPKAPPSKTDEKAVTQNSKPATIPLPPKVQTKPKAPPKQFRLKQQKRNLYNIETQISLDTPIVEAALKSILDHLTYNKCDSFTISKGIVDFKDSRSIPSHTVQLPKSSCFKPTAFKAKLYFSNISAIHRDDNFVSFPIISEPSIQLESNNNNQENKSARTIGNSDSINVNNNSSNQTIKIKNSSNVSNNSIINNNNKSNINININVNNKSSINTNVNDKSSINNTNNNVVVTDNDNNNNNSVVNNTNNANNEEDEDTYTEEGFNMGLIINNGLNNNDNVLSNISNDANNISNSNNNEFESNSIENNSLIGIINSDYVNDYNSQSSSNNVSSRRLMKRSRYVLCSIPPVKHEAVVIISADEKQMEAINDLQSNLKELNNDNRKAFLNDIVVECSNRHIDTINKLTKVVRELATIQQQVIYQSSLADQDEPDQLAEYRKHQSKKIQMQMKMNAQIQARMAQIQNRDRTPKQNENVSKNLSALQLPSILESPSGSLMSVIGIGNDILSMSSRVVKPEPKNVVKKREPIEFIVPPEEPIPEAKILDDPFTEAVQATIANMRYIAQMKDNENEIMNTLRNDYTAYEAFLRASKLFSDNNASFIDNLKDVKESLDKVITSFNVFSKMQKGLLDLVRQSKKKAIYMAKMYTDLQKKVSEEKLSIQSKSLASIKVDDTPTFILEKIGTVIDVIDKLEISMTADESVTFGEIKTKYEKMKPTKDKVNTSKEEADKFLIKTQDFIEGLKKRQYYSSSESSEVDKTQVLIEISQNEIRTIKKKLKIVNHELEKTKRELAYSEETVNNYKDIINTMKENLQNEKNDNEQSRLMFQAQIKTLKELLKSFDEYKREKNENATQNDENPSSLEIVSKIKKEVLNMQALLDSQTVELSEAKSKLREMQVTVSENEILISQLKHNLEESELKIAELDDKYRRQKDINIFKEADQAKEKKEKGNKKGIEKLQRKQLEKAQADQEMLVNRLQKVEKKLIKTRKELNRVTDENDDLKMKFALKQYETISSIVKLSVATQTTFRLVRKKNPANNNSQTDDKANETENNNIESSNNNNDNANNSTISNENKIDKENESNNKSDKVSDDTNNNKNNENGKIDNKDSNNIVNQNNQNSNKQNNKKETNLPLNPKSNNLRNSSKLLNGSEIDLTEMEWVEEEEEENDAYNESQVFSTDNPFNENSKSDMMDDLFIEVHQPLLLTNREKKKTNRNKIFMLSDPRQKKKTPKVLNAQKKIIIPKTDNDQLLAIGFDEKHPYRPNSSMSNDAKGRKRPFTSSVNPPNYASLISKQQQPDLSVSATKMSVNTPDAARVNTTRTCFSINSNFSPNNKGIYVRLPPKIPSLSNDLPARPTTTAGAIYKNVAGNEEESFDTLRITNIQFAQQNDGKDVSRLPPIVDVSSRTTISGPLVTFSKNVRTSKSTENDEVKFLINRLRDKMKKLQKSNEKKEKVIHNLNKRLSELTIALNRAKIDAIRSKDAETRSRIRFENVNQRLSAAMDELVVRQDENSALRRQLIHLNNAALPAMPLLRRMQKAKDEQERINNQQKRTRNLIEEKKKIIGKATDDLTRSHLKTMINNSMDSLLRMEAKRRYWQEVEKKQIVGALGALSLLSQDVPDLQQLGIPYTSIFRSMKTAKGIRQTVGSARTIMSNNSFNKDIEIVSLEKKETKENASELDKRNSDSDYDDDDDDDGNEESKGNENDKKEFGYKPLSEEMINKLMQPLSDDSDDDETDDDSDGDVGLGIDDDDDDDDDDDGVNGDVSNSDSDSD